ncbi:SDR family oxidoreductase [Brevundimonas sp.]|uniref:SDR family NAD(P)-dependent oxidoreductase n=1 Tax=Brevundimonas sp. TaxID=1871086 RepID=UPI00289C0F46|nr:SDR family oxidoreductase [Brevundimonas sp.]
MRRGVVVTGGSRGIGLATARLFQGLGHEVVSLSRSAPPTPEIEHLAADITDLASVERAAALVAERAAIWDRTVLIHNAAVHRHDTVPDLSARDLLAVLSANLAAPQALNQRLVPVMKPGSSILYVGSTLAEKAVAGAASYVASKHGMIGLMRATCQDLAGSGVHTACVCPGFTDTEMLRAHVGEAIEAITGMVAAGRLLNPEEIADLIRVCADSPALNGAVLHANLGQIER